MEEIRIKSILHHCEIGPAWDLAAWQRFASYLMKYVIIDHDQWPSFADIPAGGLIDWFDSIQRFLHWIMEGEYRDHKHSLVWREFNWHWRCSCLEGFPLAWVGFWCWGVSPLIMQFSTVHFTHTQSRKTMQIKMLVMNKTIYMYTKNRHYHMCKYLYFTWAIYKNTGMLVQQNSNLNRNILKLVFYCTNTTKC